MKRFKKGDFVRMTPQAVFSGVARARETGVVATNPRRRDYVSVRLWGHRTAKTYHVDFWNHQRSAALPVTPTQEPK